MGSGAHGQTELGRRLRAWRIGRGLTQLDLAHAAGTTARYVSFVETGRSRPSTDVLLRLTEALQLPDGAIDELLHLAGLPPTVRPPLTDEDALAGMRAALEAIVSGHEPFPACLVDGLGCVRSANRTYLSLVPDALTLSPEDHVDRFFGDVGRRWIVDWPDMAWREADRRLHRAQERGDSRAIALALRALDHLRDTPRPQMGTGPASMPLRIRVGPELVLSVQTMVLRLDGPPALMDDELQLELSIPADSATRQWFIRRAG